MGYNRDIPTCVPHKGNCWTVAGLSTVRIQEKEYRMTLMVNETRKREHLEEIRQAYWWLIDTEGCWNESGWSISPAELNRVDTPHVTWIARLGRGEGSGGLSLILLRRHIHLSLSHDVTVGSLWRWISKRSADLFVLSGVFFFLCGIFSHSGAALNPFVSTQRQREVCSEGEGRKRTHWQLTDSSREQNVILPGTASCQTHTQKQTHASSCWLSSFDSASAGVAREAKKISVWWELMVEWTHINLLTSLLLWALSRWGLVDIFYSWWQLEAGKSHSVQIVDRNVL